MSDLWNYEHICYDEGFEIVCGIDEAGRGGSPAEREAADWLCAGRS